MAKTTVDPLIPESDDRQIPEIDPARVTLQYSGLAWREYQVIAPAGFVAADLNEAPEAWRKLQNGSRNALRKFDRVMVIDHDENWFAEATVAFADHKSVIFARPKITSLPSRVDKLFETEEYRVKFLGSGSYAVERKRDGAIVTQQVASAELAARDLNNLYPRKAA
ncbi:hypothetical protein [Mesorhizobium sp.]|uniref:hypothetical protein n=1 Tax=Mesorhizobium sp. TaxID=1871066 RepID=UPI001200BE7F|nr:hypothetical protein [Mesorhizobium sp.]TIL43413.1 MAG: hypothetical protein E5Y86_22470 [Mesorhizobium sp.]